MCNNPNPNLANRLNDFCIKKNHIKSSIIYSVCGVCCRSAMRTQWMICHSLNGASSKYATAVQQGPTIDTVCRATLIGDVSATRTTVHPVQSTTSPFHFQACLTVTNGSGGSLTTTTDLMCSDGTGVGVVVGRGVCSTTYPMPLL